MKRYIIPVMVLIFVGIGYCVSILSNEKANLNPGFDKAIVSALKLKFIASDSIYGSGRSRIFNDTIVGFYYNDKPGTLKNNLYFIQSLKNLRTKSFLSYKEIIHPNVSQIDTYKNGCLY